MLGLGAPEADQALGGGLRRDALHEIRAETTREAASAAGFATALLVRLTAADDRPILLVLEEAVLREGGHPYGPGIGQFGLAADRLVVVETRRP
ncbi:MAG: hypothetical protein J0H08_07875, partial [Rhizobiales bacterium]|nr:hypothetical protein [Hyphomicrobiales bacterium]